MNWIPFIIVVYLASVPSLHGQPGIRPNGQELPVLAPSLRVVFPDMEPSNEIGGLSLHKRSAIICSPVLPYLFFDSASALIPARYVQFNSYEETLGFDEFQTGGNALAKHWHLLNVAGYRLRNDSTFVLGIRGCNSGESETGENLVISEQRGHEVYEYLKDIWRIPDGQLHLLDPRNLPLSPETGGSEHSRAMNRRIEFEVVDNQDRTEPQIDWKLRRPLLDTGDVMVSWPTSVVFKLENGMPDSQVSHREILLYRNDRLWTALRDSGEITSDVEYAFTGHDWEQLGPTDSVLAIGLVIHTVDDQIYYSNRMVIPLTFSYDVSDSPEIKRWDFLYGVNGTDVLTVDSVMHKGLREFFCPQADELTSVTIEISAHDMGLAGRSVKNARYLAYDLSKRILPCSDLSQVKRYCYGSRVPFYTNSLPEGRFLNRMVRITGKKR